MDIYYEHNNELKKATLNVSEEKPSDFVFLGPIPQDNTLGSAILVGRYDTILRKVRYQLEGISSSGEMRSLGMQNIIGFCLENRPNIDPNSLSLYPNWQTIKVIPNPEERGPLELPDAYEYLGDVSLTSCSYVEGREVIKEETQIQDFDYAVIKYKWTLSGGKDLDTRTYISTPNRSSVGVVGWNRNSRDGEYLIWNNDNTNSGVEGVLVNISNLRKDFPSQKDFVISLRAFWYNTVSSGDLSVEVNTYKGGTMNKSGYDWQNTGGTLVQNLSFNTNTQLKTQDGETLGTSLGFLSYNTDTNTGRLSNVPIEDVEVVEPIEPSEPIPAGFDFSVYQRYRGPQVQFYLTMDDVTKPWKLMQGSTVICEDSAEPNTTGLRFRDGTFYREGIANRVLIRLPFSDTLTQYRLITESNNILFTSSIRDKYETDPVLDVRIINFSDNITSYKFNIIDSLLHLPDAIPPTVTSMFSMFRGTRFISGDITGWDVSNVTDMEYAFAGCTDFNQDISGWDVSNVTNFYRTFTGATAFNQDLSGWCVPSFDIEPALFSTGCSNWTLPKPVWGTCPGIDDELPVSYPTNTNQFIFGIQRFENKPTKLTTVLMIEGYSTSWSIKDYLTGAVLASNTVPSIDSTKVKFDFYNGKLRITITHDHYEKHVYELNTNGRVLEFDSSSPTVDSQPTSIVDVYSFSNVINKYLFDLDGLFTVPNYLPPNVVDTAKMFESCNYFGSDISNWDVSNVTTMSYMFKNAYRFESDLTNWNVSNVINMSGMFNYAVGFNGDISSWDVSNVTNMSYMFTDARKFNKDISNWNVKHIKTKPVEFDQGATNWTKPKPIWGGANFTTVDLTGQSGVYITLSKNGGDWITYNLSDPNFNQNDFLKFVSYNESNTALAFKGYSSSNNETFTAICGFTEDGFARTPVSSEDTIGKLYLDDKQTVVPQILNIESTELVAKPTEGMPREYDLYYSLTGANSSETVVIKSAASVKVEDFVPPPSVVVLDDYLLRYDFNGDITDLSENNYEGVQSSPMSFVEGRKTNTQAINFVDHTISINSLNINSDQVTITCWLKGGQDSPGCVFNFGTNYSGFNFFYNNRGGEYNLTDLLPAGQTMTSVDKSPYNNVWTFITLVLDRREETKSLHIYANNELISSSNITYQTSNYSAGDFIIGKAGTRFPFVGYMQDLKVYPRILTSEEQTQLFNE